MFINWYLENILVLAGAWMMMTGKTSAVPTAEQLDISMRATNGSSYNATQLTYFGERASWSPDGSKIAFMSKSFGDAFEMDMTTNQITLLTHYPNAGYLRVQYLPNGDFLLIGARTFQDIETTRDADEEMWVLKQGEDEPIALQQKIHEGVAISRKNNRIAWAISSANYPDRLVEGETAMYVADIVYTNGQPALANQREVMRAMEPSCNLEPQDFRNDDSELTYTCYILTDTEGLIFGDVRGVNLETGDVVIYRDVPGEYNEVEGIFPDGRYTMVESGKDQVQPNGSRAIDIWRLKLEPNSTDFVRLTYLGDNPGNKASNPVVSPDGRTMIYQAGHSEDAAGVGYGLYLIALE